MARKYLGYDRLEVAELVPLINHYYVDVVGPLINHFFPTFKLKDKQLLKSRKNRIYGPPVTPYDRVMNSAHVSVELKEHLRETHDQLNPVALSRKELLLRRQIDKAVRLQVCEQNY